MAANSAVINNGLAEAFMRKAELLGKRAEGESFLAQIKKDVPDKHAFEKTLVCAWADGLLYGNWPWRS